MGRGAKNKQPWKNDGQDWGHLWRGAWSPQLRAEQQSRPWRQQSAQAPAFPSYTTMPQPTREQRHQTSTTEQAAPQFGRAQGLQGLLNTARKAEVKLQKLLAAKDKAAEQWTTFQKGLEESFLRERARYSKDVARRDRDIDEATSEQTKSYEAIQNAFMRRNDAPDVAMEQAEAEEEWARLRSGWEQEEGSTLERVLQTALAAPRASAPEVLRQLSPEIQRMLISFGSSMATASMTPGNLPTAAEHPQPSTAGVVLPTTASTAPTPSLVVHKEAPQASFMHPCPSQKVELAASPSHPGQRVPSAARVPTTVEAPRQDVKSATKHGPEVGQLHVPLADKLAVRRAMDPAHPLLPFGGAGNRHPVQPHATPAPDGVPAGVPTVSLDEEAREASGMEDEEFQDGIQRFLRAEGVCCLVELRDSSTAAPSGALRLAVYQYSVWFPSVLSLAGSSFAFLEALDGFPIQDADELPFCERLPLSVFGVYLAGAPLSGGDMACLGPDGGPLLSSSRSHWSHWAFEIQCFPSQLGSQAHQKVFLPYPEEEGVARQHLFIWLFLLEHGAPNIRIGGSGTEAHVAHRSRRFSPGQVFAAPPGLITALASAERIIAGLPEPLAPLVGDNGIRVGTREDTSDHTYLPPIDVDTVQLPLPRGQVVDSQPREWLGTAQFIAYPKCLDHLGKKAIILDMSRAHGHYFADILPSPCEWELLCRHVTDIADGEPAGLCFWAGPQCVRVNPGDTIDLEHGDTVVVLPAGYTPEPPLSIASLFVEGALWTMLHQVSTDGFSPGLAAHFLGSVHPFAARHLDGTNVSVRLSQLLGVSEQDMYLRTIAGLSDLDVQGEPCHCLILAASLDAFQASFGTLPFAVVLDARPIGGGLQVRYTTSSTFGASQLAACLCVPESFAQNLNCKVITAAEPASLACCLVEVTWRNLDDASRISPEGRPSWVPHIASAIEEAISCGEPSVARAMLAPTPAADDNAVDSELDTTSEVSDQAPTYVANFLLVARHHSSQRVTVRLRRPATTQAALDAITQATDDEFYRRFSQLVPARQQVSPHWGLIFALPAWAQNEPLCVIDLRPIDDRLFVADLPRQTSRAELLDRFGFEPDFPCDVYAFGSGHPLADHEDLTLESYGVICFCRPAAAVPDSIDLPSMLVNLAQWNEDAPLPLEGDRNRAQQVCLVHENGFQSFTLLPGRHAHHQLDVANALRQPLHWSTIQCARPPVHDAVLDGKLCKGVVSVTDRIPNVPVPPRRLGPNVFTIIMDCRPILMGFEQWVVTEQDCSHTEIVEHYELWAPAEHQVQVEGAFLEGDQLLVVPGQVLLVQFVPESPPPEAQADNSAASVGQMDADSDAHSEDRSDPPRTIGREPRSRSRDRVTTHRASDAEQNRLAALLSTKCAFLFPAPEALDSCLHVVHDFRAPGCFSSLSFPLKSVVLMRKRDNSRHRARNLARTGTAPLDVAWASRLRPDMAHASSTGGTQEAATDRLARALQEDPGMPGGRPPQLTQPVPQDGQEALQAMVPFRANFVVLNHDYWPELLTVRLTAPCDLDEALTAVSEARLRADRQIFPQLVPVHPQICPGYALLVALPVWRTPGCLVVLDTSRLNGRTFFTALVAETTNLASLFETAQIERTQHILVYIGDMPWPLAPDVEVQLQTGDLVLFAPVDHPVLVLTSLADMLLSAQGWVLTPDVPGIHGQHMWVLTHSVPFRHSVQADRSRQVRTDIARHLGCAPDSMRLLVARPHIRDHAAGGLLTNVVVLALEHRAGPSNQPQQPVCFLDLRALMYGITWQFASTGFLSQRSLLRHIRSLSPPGWSIALFEGDRRIDPVVDRVPVADGTVLVARLFAAPVGGLSPRVPPDPEEEDDVPRPGSRSPPAAVAALDARGGAPLALHASDAQAGGGGHGAPAGAIPDTGRQAYARVSSGSRAFRPSKQGPVLRGMFVACLGVFGSLPGMKAMQLSSPSLSFEERLPSDVSSISDGGPFPGIAAADHASARVVKCAFGHSDDALTPGPQRDTPVLADAICPTSIDRPQGQLTAKEASGLQPRPLPTPCRAPERARVGEANEPYHPGEVTSGTDQAPFQSHLGPTLLEVSVSQPGFTGFFEACTLVEVLVDHFGHGYRRDPEVTDIPSPSSQRPLISLSESIPLSAFQRQCLDLRSVVPVPTVGTLEVANDWLDNDLSALIVDTQVPTSLREAFSQIQLWHTCCTPDAAISNLHIYTDGSAAVATHDISPASWVFGVWCEMPSGLFYYGGASGCAVPPDTPYHVGETTDTPVQAELLALIWALAWTVQYAPALSQSLCFHYDATSVGLGVFGEHRAVDCEALSEVPALSVFAGHLRQYADQLSNVSHAHIKSHTGCVPNELVDQQAKCARRAPDSIWERCLPQWLARLTRHPLAAWTWMLASTSHDLPALFAMESESYRLQSSPHLPKVFHRYGQREVRTEAGLVRVEIIAISYNALTLKDKRGRGQPTAEAVGLRIAGRRAVLMRELEKYTPLLVGIQETRLPETAVLPDCHYIMLQAGATEQGVGGCALWIARHRPYGFHQGKPLFFREVHATVTGYSHRHLHVCLEAPFLRLFVSVLHGPSLANHTETEVAAFWRDRLCEIQRRPPGMDYLLLVDSNARLGDLVSAAIGSHQAEPETLAGALFHDFVLALDGFLPATFSDFQSGPGTTWCGTNGSLHRIDYVVLPQSWRSFEIQTRTLLGFEALQTKDDHTPVYVAAHFGRRLKADRYFQPFKAASRPQPAPAGEPRSKQLAALRELRTASWTEDVDAQYDHFVRTWSVAGACLDDAPARQLTQPHISPDSLALIDTCRALRAYLRREAREREHRLKIIAFASFVLLWNGATFSPQGAAAADQWLWQMDWSEARAVALLKYFVAASRRAVRTDRTTYLQGLVTLVCESQISDPKALYRAVRKAFPSARSARRSSFTPLPSLILPSKGVLAVTQEEKTEGWRQHFSAQEAGEPMDSVGYLATLQDRLSRDVVPFDINDVPSLFEIEQIIMGLKKAKAPGPDGITSDLLRLWPVHSARHLFPILVKSSISVCEPLAFRGGSLHCLAKKAGAALRCQQFRSILLASTPGKILHRATRNRLIPLLQAHGSPTQAGTVPGVGIEAISLLVRTFQASRHHSAGLWSWIFYDLQAAFYRVVRETLFTTEASDTELCRLIHRLGLPPSAMEELTRQLRTLAILPDFGASEHLAAVVNDMLQATWFTIGFNDVVTLTRKGSRPGDPAADVIFSLVFAAFVKSVEARLKDLDLLPEAAVKGPTHPWASVVGTTGLGLPSWADDFVSPIAGRGPRQLLESSQQTARVVQEVATAIGMRLTYAADKTAALFPCGVDWLQHGAKVDPELGVGFVVADRLSGESHHVPIVEAYKHLGHILTSSTRPQPDIQLRAQSVIKPLKSKLFGNKAVPLRTRVLLLRSLAVSRFVHSSAAVILTAATHEKLWDRAFLDLWRPLLPRTSADKQAHSFEVLRVAEAPSPPLALAQARANFLRQLTRHGPAVLRFQLWQHWLAHPKSSWLQQIEADIDLVLQYRPDLAPLFSVSSRVATLLDALQEEPGWWLSQVKKACKVFQRDLAAWHQQGCPSVAVPQEDTDQTGSARPHQCPLCSACFLLRKHLGAHMAKAHKTWSPTRHYTLDVYCHACHVWYGTASQVNFHLKRYPACLRRVSLLFPPLTTPQIRSVEFEEQKLARRVRQGQWASYKGVRQRSIFFGPRTPTASERMEGVDYFDESCALSDLRKVFQPDPADLEWIEQYIAERSSEGPRQSSGAFWRNRAFHCFTANS
ncbi:unnamed protein product [Symbiodinium sp. CCMP2456]|nr:unnamed protein product [Symbiodinium sp. CCMP2456]